jgi:heavy metal sensor kinase
VASFRLKLSLLAAGTSAVMILGFGFTIMGFVEHAGRAHLDRELRAVAMHFMEFGPARLEQGGDFYGEELHQIAFAVDHAQRGQLYRSPRWPERLDQSLPALGAGEGGLRRCPHAHTAWSWHPGGFPGDVVDVHTPAPDHDPHHDPHHGMRRRHPPPPPPRGCPCANVAYRTLELDDAVWRVGAFPDGPLTLYVAVDLSRFHDRAGHVTGLFLIVLIPTLLVAAAGGWWLAGRALRPVAALTEAAEGITAAQLERRIPESGDREFARLTRVFNDMLGRLQRSYQQAVRFSADVSHELNTPLTIMQGEVETALTQAPEGSPAQLALASQLEEVQRLKGMVKKLLLLSRADAGTLSPQLEAFDLSGCVADCCEDFEALAPELRFEVEVEPGLTVQADPSLLPLIPQNLLANAVRYNQPDGFVRVTLAREDGRVRLRVANSGLAIAGEDRERVFERFYRGDPARGREAGAGLGLSLAREFARAHGGDLVLEPAADATTFVLRLPV